MSDDTTVDDFTPVTTDTAVDDVQQEAPDFEIPLQLFVSEVNVILGTLGQLPHDKIHALIVKIKEQGDAAVMALVQSDDTTVTSE